jgi:hypothetical protein
MKLKRKTKRIQLKEKRNWKIELKKNRKKESPTQRVNLKTSKFDLMSSLGVRLTLIKFA